MKIWTSCAFSVLVFTFCLIWSGSHVYGADAKKAPAVPQKTLREEIAGNWTIKAVGTKAADGVDISKMKGDFPVFLLPMIKDEKDITGTIFGNEIITSEISSASVGAISFSTVFDEKGKSLFIKWTGTLDSSKTKITAGTFECSGFGSGTFTATKDGSASSAAKPAKK